MIQAFFEDLKFKRLTSALHLQTHQATIVENKSRNPSTEVFCLKAVAWCLWQEQQEEQRWKSKLPAPLQSGPTAPDFPRPPSSSGPGRVPGILRILVAAELSSVLRGLCWSHLASLEVTALLTTGMSSPPHPLQLFSHHLVRLSFVTAPALGAATSITKALSCPLHPAVVRWIVSGGFLAQPWI